MNFSFKDSLFDIRYVEKNNLTELKFDDDLLKKLRKNKIDLVIEK